MGQLLDQLIHDVNSKCGSLKSAAGLLKSASPNEARDVLALMLQEAEALARSVAQYMKTLDREL